MSQGGKRKIVSILLYLGAPTVGTLMVMRMLLPLMLILSAPTANAVVVVRSEIEPGVHAALRNGNAIILECRPPKGTTTQSFFNRFLSDPERWKQYKGRMAVAIPWDALNAQTRRTLLEAIFPKDFADPRGWWHTVLYDGVEGQETWHNLAAWFTGSSTNVAAIRAEQVNAGLPERLKRGDRVFIPAALLNEVMRKPTPGHEVVEPEPEALPVPPPAPAPAEPATDTTAVAPPVEEVQEEEPDKPIEAAPKPNGDLSYASDDAGPYAIYKLKKGEALYTAVVARFTNYRENKEMAAACDIIVKRSGIRNVRKMEPGDKVLIPLYMLSDQYHPQGSEQRQVYDAVRAEVQRLQQEERVVSKDLEGIVVVLDAGHGGRDHGAEVRKLGLYEDELNYDIVCRIKKLLEEHTAARVYVTVEDKSQGNTITNAKRFTHDKDEVLLTTPQYANTDATYSANLRWYLANAIYRKEKARGVDDRNMVFMSIHCDALYYKLRGTMVYVPGARYYNGNGDNLSSSYERYAEAKGHRVVKKSSSQRQKEEALSRNFAATLCTAVRTHNPPLAVHKNRPIRENIFSRRNRPVVPAVLRNTLIPTRVLVETANLNNGLDQQRLADPDWRQWYAEACVDALKKHFKG